MPLIRRTYAVLRQPEIFAICLVVFIADLVMGIIVPTFSLFATNLGASLALVGTLTGMSGIASIFASVPVGVLSDKLGRKRVISAGMLFFALSSFLYTVVPDPVLLIPVRILASFGLVGVFMVGVAYVGDVVDGPDRGVALGLYSTGMALGFTIGPFLGGIIAERFGYNITYQFAALISLIGFIVALRWITNDATPTAKPKEPDSKQPSFLTRLRGMVQNPKMGAACLAYLGNNVAFTTIFSFVPLYAASLLIGESIIGSMFAVRGIASTLSRIPTGLLTARISGRVLMIAGLGLAALGLILLTRTTSIWGITLILIADGIAYGLFLTAGQSHITNLSSATDRGSAVGIYTMAGSIGGALGPIAMGVIAELFGLPAVFWLSAAIAIATALVLKIMGQDKRQTI